MLKDDNLGLGARRNQGDECTGLDALQELLGRLNGKSEGALAQERKLREDAHINKYLHRKLGTLRFVHGGFLVGDKVQELADGLKKEKEEAAAAAAEAEASGAKESKKDKKSKKRKAGEEEETDDVVSEKKKEKKSKKRKTEDGDDDSKARRREKKEKKRKDKAESTSESTAESGPRNDEEGEASDAGEDITGRKKSKKDKKDKRKKSRDDEEAIPEDGSDSQSKKKKKRKSEKEEATESSKSPPLATASSTTSGTTTPSSEVPHRHLARKRFIAQKRAAVMDQAALDQVWLPTPRTSAQHPVADVYIDIHDQGVSEHNASERQSRAWPTNRPESHICMDRRTLGNAWVRSTRDKPARSLCLTHP